jgi:hypothetical protein
MQHHIEKAVTDGAVPARRALRQALVHRSASNVATALCRVPRAMARTAGFAPWRDRHPRQDSNLRPSA